MYPKWGVSGLTLDVCIQSGVFQVSLWMYVSKVGYRVSFRNNFIIPHSPCSPMETKSARARNYAVAGFFILFCILLVIGAVTFFFQMFLFGNYGISPANIWSECRNNSAHVFIGANSDLSQVKCVALDQGLFDTPEIAIGDLSKNDEDVCRFTLSRETTQPLRFEVWYNGKAEREVCDWQSSQTVFD